MTLKELRKRCGLTREQTAKAAGLSYQAIAMYEQGRREPKVEIMKRLAEVFHVEICDIVQCFGGEASLSTEGCLEKISTRILCDELRKREGVQEIVGEPYQPVKIEVEKKALHLDVDEGPFIILLVYD